MSINICVAQSKEEINFILKNIKEKVKVLPLDLSSQLYCINNNIDYFDPLQILPKDFHFNAIEFSENQIKNLKYKNFQYESAKTFTKRIIRFQLNSTIFIYELLDKITKNFDINKIIISGWQNKQNSKDSNNYIISKIIFDLELETPIEKILNENIQNQSENNYYKYYCDEKLKNKKKNILLSNLGYNFKRITNWAYTNKYNCILLDFGDFKINFLKKYLFKILGIHFLNIKKVLDKNQSKIDLEIPKCIYKNKDFTPILVKKFEEIKIQVIDFVNQSSFLEDFFKQKNISLIICNMSNNIAASYSEVGKLHNIKSLNVSHGTIAEAFNDYDKLYKKIIAEGVFSGAFTYFSLQSKITKKSVETHEPKGKLIETSNLIFAEDVKKSKNRNKILYPVTMKNFETIQYLGVEMFYEFLSNLKILENISSENGLDIVVKLHPIVTNYTKDIEKIFPKLKFSKGEIKQELNESFVTINFSSTTIEDSLYCKVPVILFDQWKRYRHCESTQDTQNGKIPIYYVNNKKDLIAAINTVEKKPNYDFNRFIYDGKSKENISRTLKNILY